MGCLRVQIEPADPLAHRGGPVPEFAGPAAGGRGMTPKVARAMFLTGAVFNWLVGLALLLDAALLFDLFAVKPIPTEQLFVQLFAWLVIIFGVGYLWVSRDPLANVPIIKLGMLGKTSVFLVCLAAVVAGTVSWQMMILASVDLVYAILFWRALQALR
jgi:hypothetical protein